MSELPPPPGWPPPPPDGFGSPQGQPQTPWAGPPGPPYQPEWGPYAVPVKKRSRFVWWEALLGAFAGVAGNLVLLGVSSGSGQIAGPLFLLFNLGFLITPLALRHWSYTVGFVVGVIGAIALFIVIVIFTCSSQYGGSGG